MKNKPDIPEEIRGIEDLFIARKREDGSFSYGVDIEKLKERLKANAEEVQLFDEGLGLKIICASRTQSFDSILNKTKKLFSWIKKQRQLKENSKSPLGVD